MSHHPLYQKAKYLLSSPNLASCPPDQGFEVAFAGRSNAGKSSALNTITSQKSLARTSKTPGRTQMLNFFELDEERKLVDLPGYGFAKVSTQLQQQWQEDLSAYVEEREVLKGMIVLMDIRHPMQPLDEQMVAWCYQLNLPVHVLLTKADKMSRNQGMQTLFKVQKLLHPYPETTIQLFSATNRTGLEDAWSKLDEWMEYSRS